MELIESADEARRFVAERTRSGKTVGLIPTMGALHRGHLSLVEASNRCCDFSVATIFVNPTQFAPGEDLAKYPRTMEADLDALRATGTDAVFCPTVDEVYPPGFSTSVKPPKIAERWEGEFRPEHFEGVATVVLKLFQMLPGTHAFFGQKDYQQLRVIQTMVTDLNVSIEVVPCEIVREQDGLAMSSRNRYLDDEERSRSLRLSAALESAHDALRAGETDTSKVRQILHQQLLPGLSGGTFPRVDSIDYAEVVDAVTLEPISVVDRPVVCLIACYVGKTRLIDNLIWDPPPLHSLPESQAS
ncbi:MAG: pantoate--beta-alanine ligase [Planctomycetota bacterium]